MQMAYKANAIIPALLTKCLFVSFQLYLVYLVNWIHYELESKLKNYFAWMFVILFDLMKV